uniref:Nucleocapsid n=1 Tax=Feline morbillivirus TaxID=1170234 RepID=A0A4Y5S458_9MONO|nr:nucleoprotein N [Feline morbillivirus]
MSSLLRSPAASKRHREQPTAPSGSGGTIKGLKNTIIVPVPGDTVISTRSNLLFRLVYIIGNPDTPLSTSTGAIISLLTLFVESPGQLIQRIADDPDAVFKLVEVVPEVGNPGELTFASRGINLDKQAQQYFKLAEKNDQGYYISLGFENPPNDDDITSSPEIFNYILASVLAQVWILLAKAVTAPDTAAEAENRRWIKLMQQRRVDGELRLSKGWLDLVRNKIASDITIRRFMVALVLDIKRSPGTRPRIAEMICDIDNYVVEAGLASFLLTIKFGIETRYPALALHEFSGELATIEGLMKLYQSMGEMAPYMVILENSIQTRFSAGSYPLLWSYAMGVGVELERSMGGLNFTRSFFDPTYFRLGQEMVRRSSGMVNSSFARELGLSEHETQLVSQIVNSGSESSVPKFDGFRANPTTFLGAKDNINDRGEDQSSSMSGLPGPLLPSHDLNLPGDPYGTDSGAKNVSDKLNEGISPSHDVSSSAMEELRRLVESTNKIDTKKPDAPGVTNHYNDTDLLK